MDSDIDLENGAHGAWSRRTLLKGAAAGTALWAVPSVTTLGSRAFAGSAQPCGPLNCMSLVQCATAAECSCAELESGVQSCFLGGSCSGTPDNICNNDKDCVDLFGAGSQCFKLDADSCVQCGGSSTFCAVPCAADGQAVKKGNKGTRGVTAVN